MAQGNLSKMLSINPTIKTPYKVSEILNVNTIYLLKK